MLNPFDPELDTTMPDWYVDLLVGFNMCNKLLIALDIMGLLALALQS